MTAYLICVLWFSPPGASDASTYTVKYAKGSHAAVRITRGLWLKKAYKGYCLVGDELREKTYTRVD